LSRERIRIVYSRTSAENPYTGIVQQRKRHPSKDEAWRKEEVYTWKQRGLVRVDLHDDVKALVERDGLAVVELVVSSRIALGAEALEPRGLFSFHELARRHVFGSDEVPTHYELGAKASNMCGEDLALLWKAIPRIQQDDGGSGSEKLTNLSAENFVALLMSSGVRAEAR